MQVVFRGGPMVKSGIPVPSPLSSHSLAAQGLGSKPATPTSAAAGVCVLCVCVLCVYVYVCVGLYMWVERSV